MQSVFKHDSQNPHTYVSAQISNMNCQRCEMIWKENYQEKYSTSDWNINSNEAFGEASIQQLNTNVEPKMTQA